jgi:LPS export ABC transporter protein LptC
MVSPAYIKPLLALLVVAAIIGIATVVLRNGSPESAPVHSANQQLPHNIDVVLKKARFSEIQDGITVWELDAEQADYDKKGDMAYLTDIRMVFPHTRSHGAVTVTADYGEYSTSTKNILLKGHVHAVTEDGARFNTSSIIYTGAKDQFSTTYPVLFRQQRLLLNAVGMDYGVENQLARFYSLVDATVLAK